MRKHPTKAFLSILWDTQGLSTDEASHIVNCVQELTPIVCCFQNCVWDATMLALFCTQQSRFSRLMVQVQLNVSRQIFRSLPSLG